MRDLDRFETALEARLQAHVGKAGRSIDAIATARAAMAVARANGHVGSRIGLGRRGPRLQWLRLRIAQATAVGVLTIALVGTGALLLGTFPEASLAPGSSSPSPVQSPTAPPPTGILPSPSSSAMAGTFERTGSLGTARSGHTAVLLRDGRVLVIGGWTDVLAPPPAIPAFDRRSAPPPSEIYDPISGAFSSIDPIVLAFNRGNEGQEMNQASFSATVLADGRVLVAGGRLGLDSDGIGAVPPPPPAASAVLFDPVTERTTPTGAMTVARAGHAAVLLPDGRVLIAGGVGKSADGGEASLSSAEIYDPATGLFSPTGSMASDRAFPYYDLAATVLPSGRILVSGGGHWRVDATGLGGGGGGDMPSEIYDPMTGTFDGVPSGRWAETGAVLLLQGDRIYVDDLATGVRTDITPQPAALVQEFGSYCADLPTECRSGMTTTLLANGRILLAGGSVVVIDQSAPSGWRTTPQPLGELFDPDSLAVAPTGSLVGPRTAHTATLLPDGRVLLIGGYVPGTVQNPTFLASVELFDPSQ